MASRTVGPYLPRTFALLRALKTQSLAREPDVEGVCPRWASPPPDTRRSVFVQVIPEGAGPVKTLVTSVFGLSSVAAHTSR
jgi:hypothetical protein